MEPDLNFSFLDMKILSQLAVLLVIWIQFIKEYIPDRVIKVFSLVSGCGFYLLIINADSIYAQVLLYGIVASAAGGLGYKVLQLPK